ncbi:MAG: hypothetical protein V3S69_05945 [Dehalococcoidales bacterium]
MMGSPKVDGLRVPCHPELGPVTSSFMPLPNKLTRDALRKIVGNTCLDGELMAVDAEGKPLTFNETQSAFMTRGGQPAFLYLVFDCFDHPEDPFITRYADAYAHCESINHKSVACLRHIHIKTLQGFRIYAAKNIADGYEGTMLRDPNGPYKSGRSTLKQQWLLKYKEWVDTEGTITGFDERMHNANEDVRDNFDRAKRSSHKENMIPMGTLGALILDTEWGELHVGTGFDDALRQEIWDHNMDHAEMYKLKQPAPGRDMGRTVTFKYQPFGMQDKPRFPVFLHFREGE